MTKADAHLGLSVRTSHAEILGQNCTGLKCNLTLMQKNTSPSFQCEHLTPQSHDETHHEFFISSYVIVQRCLISSRRHPQLCMCTDNLCDSPVIFSLEKDVCVSKDDLSHVYSAGCTL